MAIRLRTAHGIRVALCANETDWRDGDVYLDDGDHYALAAKFSLDWPGEMNTTEYPETWAAMETQKLRDARATLLSWFARAEQAELDRWQWEGGR